MASSLKLTCCRLPSQSDFFTQAQKRNIGILARVPLASGLLTGKFDKQSTFTKDDHRHFNRDGEVFDKGETFSGVNYDLGLEVVNDLKQLFPDYNLTHLALQWIISFAEVSCAIPGASNKEQVLSNLSAFNAPEIDLEMKPKIEELYALKVKDRVHHLW